MKFNAQVHVVGMKSSKGTMDNGATFDSTKVYVLTDLDMSKGTAKGMAVSEYGLGTSEEFGKYKHLDFPFVADAEVEIVSNGKIQKTIVHSLTPKARAPKQG